MNGFLSKLVLLLDLLSLYFDFILPTLLLDYYDFDLSKEEE